MHQNSKLMFITEQRPYPQNDFTIRYLESFFINNKLKFKFILTFKYHWTTRCAQSVRLWLQHKPQEECHWPIEAPGTVHDTCIFMQMESLWGLFDARILCCIIVIISGLIRF